MSFIVITAKKQIHSADIRYINDSNIHDEFYCDGFVISNSSFKSPETKKIGIGIRTADCVPILFSDEINSIYGAAHAGWRGTVGQPSGNSRSVIPGIAAETVRIMCQNGSQPQNIKVAIGACIHDCCFEVRNDFREAVIQRVGLEFTDKFVKPDNTETTPYRTYHADLVGMNVDLLIQSGVSSDNILIANVCTCCNSDTFFSYRAEKKLNGTMISAIRLPF